MLRAALLVSLIGLSLQVCYYDYDLRIFETGDTFTDGCEDCVCESSGVISCTEHEGCCLYVGSDGYTARALPGERFNDGCNTCKCGENGRNGRCTRKSCGSKCRYENWDLMPGYASVGSSVEVYDRVDECPKFCECVRTVKGKVAKAAMVCPDVYACIYH